MNADSRGVQSMHQFNCCNINTVYSIIQMLVVGFAPVNRSSIFLIPVLLAKCQDCVDHEYDELLDY